MTRAAVPVDISAMPEVVELAEEVERTQTPRVLRRDGKDVALLSPVPKPRRRTGKRVSQADMDATLAAFGSWKGHIDAEAFKRQIKDARADDQRNARS